MTYSEEICERFYKSDEELEKDLMTVLKCKNTGDCLPGHIRGDYASALLDLLYKMDCLEDKVWHWEISKQGKKFIERGWVTKDYTTPKRQENWKIYREWIALIIALAIGILGLFFP